MKKTICLFLIFVMIVSLCSCGNNSDDNIIDNKDSTKITEGEANTIETASAEDIKPITDFYDCINTFYCHMTDNQYFSLKAELSELSNDIALFDNIASTVTDNEKFSSYYTEVLNNPFYNELKEWANNPNQEIDIDLSVVQSTWAYIFSEYAESILEIELPFSYDKSKKSNNDKNATEYDDIKFRDDVSILFTNAINQGLELYNVSNSYYTELNNPRTYDIGGQNIEFDIGFEYEEILKYQFIIILSFRNHEDFFADSLVDKVYSITFRNGKKEYKLNSNHIETFGMGIAPIAWVCLYKSSFNTEEESNYKEIKTMFATEGEISLVINDNYSFALSESDKKLIIDYFALNDTIMNLINNKYK